MLKHFLLINGSSTGIPINIAGTFFEKLKGLMFSKQTDQALLLLRCNSIHTFFMHFNIDTVFISKENRIVKIKGNLRPWRIVSPVFSASKILEIPTGLLDISSFKEGDRISFD